MRTLMAYDELERCEVKPHRLFGPSVTRRARVLESIGVNREPMRGGKERRVFILPEQNLTIGGPARGRREHVSMSRPFEPFEHRATAKT
jgi:hypothetical protein